MTLLLNLLGDLQVLSLIQEIPSLWIFAQKSFDPFSMDLIDVEDFTKMVVRFAINILFVVVLVRYLYYPHARRKDFLFTYILIGLVVFLLCFMLENVKLELGFALGLFAIFGIIRYRTDPIPIKEMTYLFIVIGVSVMNALINKKISYTEMLFANFAVLAVTWGLEKVWLLRHESQRVILYEKIELVNETRRAELIKDLETRTGLVINRIEIIKLDFLRDTASMRIYFYEDEQSGRWDDPISPQDKNGGVSEEDDNQFGIAE